jgi:anti-sigma B factor antagonist
MISTSRGGETAMEWSARRTQAAVIARPEGHIDETSWEAFHAALTASVADAAASGLPLILDLDGVTYMSSRGLRVLTLARRDADAANISFSLARPNDRMREILAISRYDKIFAVHSALED